MIALQNPVFITARSRYHHNTLIGSLLFFVPLIGLIVFGLVFRHVDKRVHTIVRIIAVIFILLSYAVDLLLSH